MLKVLKWEFMVTATVMSHVIYKVYMEQYETWFCLMKNRFLFKNKMQ